MLNGIFELHAHQSVQRCGHLSEKNYSLNNNKKNIYKLEQSLINIFDLIYCNKHQNIQFLSIIKVYVCYQQASVGELLNCSSSSSDDVFEAPPPAVPVPDSDMPTSDGSIVGEYIIIIFMCLGWSLSVESNVPGYDLAIYSF